MSKNTMEPLSKPTLSKILGIFVLFGWLTTVACDVLFIGLPIFSAWNNSLALVLCVVLAALGWPLYQYHKGQRTHLEKPILAARTIILAQAVLVLCTCVIGWHLGALAYLLPSWSARPVHTPFFVAILAVVSYIVLGILAWFVQKWGVVKDDEQ